FVDQAQTLARDLVQPSAHAAVVARLEVERRYLGAGYGRPSDESERAKQQAARSGLELDDTYTAKAFAAALDRIALGRERNVLFWHTLSSANMAALLNGAPEELELAPEILRLAHA
ncbi:MAG TPA: hypothetical protein VFK05_32140, partial [Polyangiaceae bacterium]|nr:hypothetical protein [Polyangiaceae bacterium]